MMNWKQNIKLVNDDIRSYDIYGWNKCEDCECWCGIDNFSVYMNRCEDCCFKREMRNREYENINDWKKMRNREYKKYEIDINDLKKMLENYNLTGEQIKYLLIYI